MWDQGVLPPAAMQFMWLQSRELSQELPTDKIMQTRDRDASIL